MINRVYIENKICPSFTGVQVALESIIRDRFIRLPGIIPLRARFLRSLIAFLGIPPAEFTKTLTMITSGKTANREMVQRV
jgi:hypothetical protein